MNTTEEVNKESVCMYLLLVPKDSNDAICRTEANACFRDQWIVHG